MMIIKLVHARVTRLNIIDAIATTARIIKA